MRPSFLRLANSRKGFFILGVFSLCTHLILIVFFYSKEVPKFDEIFPSQEATERKVQNYFGAFGSRKEALGFLKAFLSGNFSSSIAIEDPKSTMSTGMLRYIFIYIIHMLADNIVFCLGTRKACSVTLVSSPFNVDDFLSSYPIVKVEKSTLQVL